jgi:hypothetical protein
MTMMAGVRLLNDLALAIILKAHQDGVFEQRLYFGGYKLKYEYAAAASGSDR